MLVSSKGADSVTFKQSETNCFLLVSSLNDCKVLKLAKLDNHLNVV